MFLVIQKLFSNEKGVLVIYRINLASLASLMLRKPETGWCVSRGREKRKVAFTDF